jgi:hypothetical protein
LWQFAQFRHTLLAEGAPADAAPVTTTTPEADPIAATPPTTPTTPTTPATVPTTQVVETDPWQDITVGDGNTAVGGSAATVEVDADERTEVLISKGMGYLDEGRVIEGRTDLNEALGLLDDAPDSDPRPGRLRQQLAELNGVIFLGSAILPEDAAAKYVDVHFGDSYQKIGHKHAVTADFLEMINPNINPRNLKPTSGVKIVEGPFHLKLVKHANRLDLYARDWYVRSYAVRLEEGTYLPRGTYRIRSSGKIRLGAKVWLGFDGAEAGTRDVSLGWIYGDAGPRAGNPTDDRSSGLKLAESDLNEVYNVLVENRSLLRVEP